MTSIRIEYPEIKPKKFANSEIIADLIFLVSHSKEKKETEKCVERIINNLQICQNERKISSDEISELRVVETFILDVKRFFKYYGDQFRYRLYLAKNAEFNNWMMFLVGSLMYPVFYFNYGAPTGFQMVLFIVFLMIMLWICELSKGSESFSYDIPPPKEESNVRNEGKWLRLKYTPIHSAQSMEKEQLALLDLRREEVVPVNREYFRLEAERKNRKLRSYVPICLFLLICQCSFVIRAHITEDEEFIASFFITFCLIVVGFATLFILTFND